MAAARMVPGSTPLVGSAERYGRTYGRARVAYVVLAIASYAALIAHLVLHAALAGLRLGATDEAADWAVLDWPIFVVPAWAMVAATLVSVALAAICLVTADERAAGDVAWLAAVGGGAFVIVPFAFAAWHVDPTGIPVAWNDSGIVLGWHWLGAPLAFVAFVALLVRHEQLRKAARRARRERTR